MASSEIVDSGRYAGQKSHFSHTCNLLSQYLKEKKGSLGDLSLDIHRNFDSTGSTTMDLLPMIEKSGESVQKSMNLFRQGAMKAESEPEKAQMTIFYADLPIARRASLTRFLEKRKDRLTAKVPYYREEAVPKKEENKAAWLGLGGQFAVKTEQY
ncbi:hypothetical protein KY285_030678 [Solanum tuberosum]|nr:hypothetical protein KY285_030678 [Solanum tuberosum]